MSPSLWFARRRDLPRGRRRQDTGRDASTSTRDGGRPAAGATDARDGADAAQARRTPASADSATSKAARRAAQRDAWAARFERASAVAVAQAPPRHQLVRWSSNLGCCSTGSHCNCRLLGIITDTSVNGTVESRASLLPRRPRVARSAAGGSTAPPGDRAAADDPRACRPTRATRAIDAQLRAKLRASAASPS